MNTILLVTVGGSHAPIVTAIKTLNPQRVIFICSDGINGSQTQVLSLDYPCEVRRGTQVIERLPNIPTQANLGGRFCPSEDVILLQNPDNLGEIYQKIAAKVVSIQQNTPSSQLRVDYTGGTKTMSVALAMVAFDYHLPLYLTTGDRTDLIRVTRGELTGKIPVAPVVVKRTLDQFVPQHLQEYNYPGAISQLQPLLSDSSLSSQNQQQIRDLYYCCRGLDAWDRFDHIQAWKLLSPYLEQPNFLPFGQFLQHILFSRSQIDPQFSSKNGIPGHGYEIVEDLLLNAERRATQARYDDAVGRLYRALELLAQVRLYQGYGIRSGNIKLEQLPTSLWEEYKRQRRKKKIKLALTQNYRLLTQLESDPLGELYLEYEKAIAQALTARNNSLFAHGFTPITQQTYKSLRDIVVQFIETAIAKLIPHTATSFAIQFPASLSFNNSSAY